MTRRTKERTRSTVQALEEDVRSVARAIDSDVSPPGVARSLTTFEDEFQSCAVQFKATSRVGTALYYRFFAKGRRCLLQRAEASGLIPTGSPRVQRLQRAIIEAYQSDTPRQGCDFSAEGHLAKVWTYTGNSLDVDEVLRLDVAPDSAVGRRDFFSQYGLRNVRFVGVDFEKGSVNLYFRRPAGGVVDWLPSLVRDVGGDALPSGVVEDIAELIPRDICIAATFAWDRPEPLRCAVYALEAPHRDGAPAPAKLRFWESRLEDFYTATPSYEQRPQSNLAWSFGPGDFYMKAEQSYRGDVRAFLTDEFECEILPRKPASRDS